MAELGFIRRRRRGRRSRCRCTPARTNASPRCTRPTSRKWSGAKCSRASAATCWTRATTSPPPSTGAAGRGGQGGARRPSPPTTTATAGTSRNSISNSPTAGRGRTAARIRAVPVEGGLLPPWCCQRRRRHRGRAGRRQRRHARRGCRALDHPASLVARGDLVRLCPVFAADARAGSAPRTCSTRSRWRRPRWCRWMPTTARCALVGGYSFAGNKFNCATQARRQPARSFKPFVYAAAFERGFNPPRSCSTRRWCSGSPRPHLAPAERQRRFLPG